MSTANTTHKKTTATLFKLQVPNLLGILVFFVPLPIDGKTTPLFHQMATTARNLLGRRGLLRHGSDRLRRSSQRLPDSGQCGWRLAVGGWRLAVGGWRLAAAPAAAKNASIENCGNSKNPTILGSGPGN